MSERRPSDVEWQSLTERNRMATFFYGVETTGVYCRASCSSRLPLRRNVRIFASGEEAEAYGFRACRKCHPELTDNAAESSAVDAMRRHLEKNIDRAVPLSELAQLTGLGATQAQKQFRAALHVSPLDYQRALRQRRLREALKQTGTVTDAIYEAGYNAASRAYADMELGMTAKKFAQGGRGERIGYHAAATEFGWIVVGATGRGLCWLALADSEAEALQTLGSEFPQATLSADTTLKKWIDMALDTVGGRAESAITTATWDLRGTAFQLAVWQALMQIPRGTTLSYGALAEQMGDRKKTRAVARACALNRVALVVPCHRVVGADGKLTGYRWGVERKAKLLAAEKERTNF